MCTIHNFRKSLGGGLNARYVAAVAIAMFAFTAAAEINPGDYISGATCEMNSSSRLTVTGGEGTLNVKLPAEITELVVTNGASLKIGIADPFAAKIRIYLYGDAANGKFATLDVNGHDLDISVIFNHYDSPADPKLHPGPGRVINTSSSPSSIVMADTGAFSGVYEELPGKISIAVAQLGYNGMFQSFPVASPDGSSAAPSHLTVSGSVQLQVVDNPGQIMFIFEESTYGEFGNPVRISEIQPTYKGVPVPVSSVWVGSSSSHAEITKDYLTDGRTDTGRWGNAGSDRRVVLFFDGNPPVDGYRIASYSGEEGYRPKGWKVYAYRMSAMGWFLVDDKTGAASSVWPKVGGSNAFTSNILFSASSRSGALTGPNTDLVLNNNKDLTIRLSSTATMKVASVSGSATSPIRIENGSAFAAGDLTGFLGSFAAYLGQGRIFVSGETVAEQPISIPSAQNLVIANGGSETASVLLDNTRSGHFFGTMKDGENGTLGLVKRGDGERVLETEAASYTGPTAIHAGTLTVARRRTYTARYIRFTPLEVRFLDPNRDLWHYAWSMNEFILVDGEGKDVAWPSGASVSAETEGATLNQLIDGDKSTRIMVKELASSQSGYSAVTIDAKENISFSAYRWCSCLQTLWLWVSLHLWVWGNSASPSPFCAKWCWRSRCFSF